MTPAEMLDLCESAIRDSAAAAGSDEDNRRRAADELYQWAEAQEARLHLRAVACYYSTSSVALPGREHAG